MEEKDKRKDTLSYYKDILERLASLIEKNPELSEKEKKTRTSHNDKLIKTADRYLKMTNWPEKSSKRVDELLCTLRKEVPVSALKD